MDADFYTLSGNAVRTKMMRFTGDELNREYNYFVSDDLDATVITIN